MLTPHEFRIACESWRSAWNPRTYCPHCRAVLAVQTAVVIATGHCPECGKRVLAELPEPDEDVELIPRPEFNAAAEKFSQGSSWILSLGALGWLVSCGVMPFLFRSSISWSFPALEIVLAIWSCIGPPTVVILLLIYWGRRAKWNPALACPSCGEADPVRASVVNTTCRCPSCGQTMLTAEEPPPNPVAKPITVAEFAARLRMRSRINTRSILLFGFTLLVFGLPIALPVLVFGRFEMELWWTRQIGEAKAYWLMGNGLGIGVFGSVVAAIVSYALYYALAIRRYPLRCPHCEKGYQSTGLVLASRRCDRCYCVAVAEGDGGATC